MKLVLLAVCALTLQADSIQNSIQWTGDVENNNAAGWNATHTANTADGFTIWASSSGNLPLNWGTNPNSFALPKARPFETEAGDFLLTLTGHFLTQDTLTRQVPYTASFSATASILDDLGSPLPDAVVAASSSGTATLISSHGGDSTYALEFFPSASKVLHLDTGIYAMADSFFGLMSTSELNSKVASFTLSLTPLSLTPIVETPEPKATWLLLIALVVAWVVRTFNVLHRATNS